MQATDEVEISVIRIVDDTLSLVDAITRLQASGQVDYAEPDYPLSIDATPNDSSYNILYGLHNTGQSGGTSDADIDAPEAWDITTGDSSVVVAVIDTGVQYDHPDLAANMWTNPGEIPGNSIDDDANGYVDDIYGIDTANGDSDPMDDNGHGTHVAGTLGAVGDNGTGVNWDTRLMALKYLDSSGNGLTSNAIELLNYVYNMKVSHGIDIRVTNNSWGAAVSASRSTMPSPRPSPPASCSRPPLAMMASTTTPAPTTPPAMNWTASSRWLVPTATTMPTTIPTMA